MFYIACNNNETSQGSDTDNSNYMEWDLIESSLLDSIFNFCYPSNLSASSFSFSEYTGKVLMIELSASW